MYQLEFTQQINAPVAEVWEYISSPGNLKDITPTYMDFTINGKPPGKMYPGMIINYNVRPLAGIKMQWVTEITHVKDHEYFIDVQRKGPYALWHHQHFLIPDAAGVLMKDIITYSPPFGFLGKIANSLFIRKQLQEIFEFRKVAFEKKFNGLK